MQRSDIAIANEYFRMLTNRLVIEQRKQARGAIPTSNANNRVDLWIRERLHQVGSPVSIGARKKAPPFAEIGAKLCAKPEGLQGSHRTIDRFWIRRSTGRGDNGDCVA